MDIKKEINKVIKNDDLDTFQNILNRDTLDFKDFQDIKEVLMAESNKNNNIEKYMEILADYTLDENDLEFDEDTIDAEFDEMYQMFGEFTEHEKHESVINNMDAISLHMKAIREYGLLTEQQEIEYSTNYNRFKKQLAMIREYELNLEKIKKFVLTKEFAYTEEPLALSKEDLKDVCKTDSNIYYLYQGKVYLDLPVEYVTNKIKEYQVKFKKTPLSKGTNEVNFKPIVDKGFLSNSPINIYYINDSHELLCMNPYVLEMRINQNRDRLVHSNLRLVIHLAKAIQGKLPLEDLIQEGSLGLMKSVEKYNPKLGFRFSTYATWWIKQSIRRAVADQGRTIRLPVHRHEQISKVDKISRRLAEELNREPSLEELAKVVEAELSISPKKLTQLLNNIHHTRSIDQQVSDDNNNAIKDYIADEAKASSPEDTTINSDLKDKLVEIFSKVLDERERTILILRNGMHSSPDGQEIEYTLQNIGQLLNLTRERVRQIEIKALKKLRHPACQKKLNGFYFTSDKYDHDDDDLN